MNEQLSDLHHRLLAKASAWIYREGGASLFGDRQGFRVLVCCADGRDFAGEAPGPTLAVLRAYQAWRAAEGDPIDLQDGLA